MLYMKDFYEQLQTLENELKKSIHYIKQLIIHDSCEEDLEQALHWINSALDRAELNSIYNHYSILVVPLLSKDLSTGKYTIKLPELSAESHKVMESFEQLRIKIAEADQDRRICVEVYMSINNGGR